MPTKHRSTRLVLLVVILVAGVCCLVVAGLGIWAYLGSTAQGASVPSSEIVTTTATPSEQSPGSVINDYSVSSDQPRVIQIPHLQLEAYVQRVGIDASNTMAAPNNIHFTGWYTGSVAPGDAGVSIINGHVSGRYEQGVFRRIANLEAGDIIRVQMGDHSWREFAVESAESYTVAEANAALFQDDASIERELHLITCDGEFDDHTQTYDRRFIVVARST